MDPRLTVSFATAEQQKTHQCPRREMSRAWSQLRDSGLTPTVNTFNSMITACGKANVGAVDALLVVVSATDLPAVLGVYPWCVHRFLPPSVALSRKAPFPRFLLSLITSAGTLVVATVMQVEDIRDMMGHYGVAPNQRTYNKIIHAYTSNGQVRCLLLLSTSRG